MSQHPASTIKLINVEPQGEGQVRVTMEMLVDVHRMAELGGNMLRAAMKQVNATAKKKKPVAAHA